MKRSPIRPVSRKRALELRQRRKVLDEIKRAHDGWVPCWYGFTGCTGRAEDGNERLTRGRGGSATDKDNIFPGCRHCHDYFHAHPKEMHELGLMPHSPAIFGGEE